MNCSLLALLFHTALLIEDNCWLCVDITAILWLETSVCDPLRDLNFTTFPGGAIRHFRIDLCDPWSLSFIPSFCISFCPVGGFVSGMSTTPIHITTLRSKEKGIGREDIEWSQFYIGKTVTLIIIARAVINAFLCTAEPDTDWSFLCSPHLDNIWSI